MPALLGKHSHKATEQPEQQHELINRLQAEHDAAVASILDTSNHTSPPSANTSSQTQVASVSDVKTPSSWPFARARAAVFQQILEVAKLKERGKADNQNHGSEQLRVASVHENDADETEFKRMQQV